MMASNGKTSNSNASNTNMNSFPSLEEISAMSLRLLQSPAASYFQNDFQEFKKNLQSRSFQRAEDVSNSINNILTNLMKLNPRGSPFNEAAQSLQTEFSNMINSNKLTKNNNNNLTGNLEAKFDAICDSLENLKDSSGRRSISELFLEVPSREDYPDYYELIKNPIAIKDLRENEYLSPKEFISDFITLVNNAQTYNESGSQIYDDSKKLYSLFVKEIARNFPGQVVPPCKFMVEQKRANSAVMNNNNNVKVNNNNFNNNNNKNNGKDEDVDVEDSMSEDEKPTKSNPKSKQEESSDDSDAESGSSDDDDDSEGEEENGDDESKKRKKAVSKSSKSNGNSRGAKRSKSNSGDIIYYDDESDEEDEEKIKKEAAKKAQGIPDAAAIDTKKSVEKILGDRPLKKENSTSTTQEFEYYVKYKGKSYLHCEWITADDILKENGGKNRLNRWIQKRPPTDLTPGASGVGIYSVKRDDEEFFPSDYCEVERILASREVRRDGKMTTVYLVKWAGLTYADSTWEIASDFKDDNKIEEYDRFNMIPAAETKHVKKKWVKFDVCPEFKGGNVLRPYQLEGMNWLTFCWHEGRGSILADEMGLGKTVQSISFMNYLHKFEKIRGPFLVVAPLSTLGHWSREFEEWTDMNVIIYQGNKQNREICRDYEFYYLNEKGQPINKNVYKFNAILTTFEMIMSQDWGDLQKIKWKSIVVDEAQRLKNHNSKLLENLRSFKSEHRILLTGTPLQNNTTELWTLLNFIEPNTFGSSKEFSSDYGQLESSEQVEKLHAILRPHLLRRMKEDVEKSIPPKEETLVEVEFTMLQKAYYKAIFDKNREFLNKGCVGKNVPNLMNIFMQLRKICNHPYLIPGVEEKEAAKAENANSVEEYYKGFIAASAKMVLLDKLLPKLKASGHKVLIFSQMVKVLDLLETYLRFRGYIYERLDGGVRRNERQASIDRFSKPGSDRFVFLLCTRAGGLGINLTAADTVIIYDSDWNPQNDIQAQARCHRIGQTNEVKVYRLITRNSYERKMFEKSSMKLGLDQAVLHNMGNPSASGQVSKDLKDSDGAAMKRANTLDKKEIDDLLKHGAYNLFTEDDKDAHFVEEDIDQILNRSSKVVWNEESAKVTGGSSFSKATFRSATGADVDLDDPNFWNKILPEAKTAQKLLDKLQTTDLLTSKEKRIVMLRDLEEMVEEVLVGFKEGKPELVSVTRSVLLEIFLLLEVNESVFTEDQKDKIARWHLDVSKPRRERKSISRFGGDLYGDSFGSQDGGERKFGKTFSFNTGKKLFGKVGKREDEEGYWKEKERKTFHSVFMAFGPGRWKDIQKKSELTRTEEEMREYAKEFIKQCIIHSDEQDRKIFVECLDSIMANDDAQEIEVELNPEFTKLIKRKLKKWGRQLRALSVINEMMVNCNNVLDDFEVPIVNKPITSWWTTEEDRSLLLGIHKYGFDAYSEIRNDPELSFKNYAKEIEAAENKFKEEGGKLEEDDKEDKDDDKEKDEEDEVPPLTTAPLVAPVKEEPSTTPSVKSEPSTGNVTSMEVDSVDSNTKPVATNAAANTKITLKLPSLWPSGKILDAHVKYLIDTIRKLSNAVEREKNRQNKQTEKQAKKQMIRENREREWTKREQIDFRNAVIQYGAGGWAVIRMKADLRKSITQLEDYFVILVELCKQMAARGNAGRGNKNRGEKDEDKDEDEEDEEEDKNDVMEVDSRGSKSKKKQEKESKADANVPKEGILGKLDFKLAPISSTMAKKLLKRVKLFDDIKNGILKNPDLDEKLERARPIDMPNWWSPANDRLLLESVARYGIGLNTDWEEFLEDEACPFYKTNTKPEHKKIKEKFLRSFVQEKPPLLRRLEYLCLIVLDVGGDHSKRLEGSSGYTSTRSFRTSDGKKKRDDDGVDGTESKPSRVALRDVDRDSDGKVVLPITIKGATIVSLGKVVHDRPSFSSKNYIWPVGFKSSRRLQSIVSGEHTTYISEILDGGNSPLFQVSPIDSKNHVIQHSTSSGAWCEMLKLIKKKPNVSVSGPEMFGFSDPTVKMLIQELPDAKLCKGYQWKDFDSNGSNQSPPSSPSLNSSMFSTPVATTRSSSSANISDINNNSTTSTPLTLSGRKRRGGLD